MADKSTKESLPFEPRKKKKKQAKQKSEAKSATSVKSSKSTAAKSTKQNKRSREDSSLSAIPDAVGKRMTRRMAFFSGIPTVLGIGSFFVFYWLFSQEIVEFPPYLVVFVTAGLFGLGFVGLSYSVFSASWDEERDGGMLGVAEFKTNVGRTVSAWKNRDQ